MNFVVLLHFTLWIVCLPRVHSKGVPDGWRMKDRFMGFRYEIFSRNSNDTATKASIRHKADELFCFGWVQDSPRQSVVGEVRCSRDNGFKMKAHLDLIALASNTTISIRDYPNTLIRLHPSHFKIFSNERNTCFRDEPHKCSRLYDETEDGFNFRDR
ncbi:hypothetical protein ACHAWO_004169 [Cyclotella atomus]|uniref:LAGLIDADG homing endonuclease n=1 Tax=Cyclotella atomus TaxID=382360 RepID=A0ABD3N806_9STRA